MLFQRLLFTFVMNQLTFKTLLMSAFIVDFEYVSGFSVRVTEITENQHFRLFRFSGTCYF